MPETLVIDHSRLKVKLGNYATGPSTVLLGSDALAAAQNYRRGTAGRMMPLSKEDIRSKLPQADFHVSRKVDGEFCLLHFESDEVFCINPGGTVRTGLPWLDEAKQLLQDCGYSSAQVVGELYADHPTRRARVHDITKLVRNPKNSEDLERIRFAPFDIVSLDGETASESYASVFQTLESVFAKSRWCTPVETHATVSNAEIENLYQAWVERENAEGLVARCDEIGHFKIKPQHTLDVVVVGFTEGTHERAGLLHDLLVAIIRSDGALQVLTKVGGGFTEEQRRSLLSDLKDTAVESEFVEVNSDYVAYQMVEPTMVVEISCLDLVAQTTRGSDVNRMVIDFDQPKSMYQVVRRMPLASVISPQFVRIREDKQARYADVRIDQITDIVEVTKSDVDARAFRMPLSEVIHREVYTKVLKGASMVRKFVILKTNKHEITDDFPAYVLHYTDFSPNRKEPLQREVVVSSSLEQIGELKEAMVSANIKKGWKPVESANDATSGDAPQA